MAKAKTNLTVVENPEVPTTNLLNFNGADKHLSDILPKCSIEYLAKNNISGYKRGWFTFNLGHQKESINAVLLAMKFSRILWPVFNPKELNPMPLCKSDNGEVSSNGSLYPVGTSCTSCKHANWKDGAPPPCSEVFSLLLYDVDDKIPFVLPVKRTGIYPLRKLKTALKLNGRKFVYPGLPVNICLSLKIETQPVDNYYVISFPQRDAKSGEELWKRLPEKEARELWGITNDLLGSFHQMGVQDISEVDSQASDIPF